MYFENANTLNVIYERKETFEGQMGEIIEEIDRVTERATKRKESWIVGKGEVCNLILFLIEQFLFLRGAETAHSYYAD